MAVNINQCIENLAYYYGQLPRIEADGTSDCPGVEEIVFKVQLAARALEEEIEYERNEAEHERREAEKKSGDQVEAWRNSARNREKAIERAEYALRKARRLQFPREPVNYYGKKVSEVKLPEYAEGCPDYLMDRFMGGR